MRLYRCELWDHVNLPQTQCQANKGPRCPFPLRSTAGPGRWWSNAHAKRGQYFGRFVCASVSPLPLGSMSR